MQCVRLKNEFLRYGIFKCEKMEGYATFLSLFQTQHTQKHKNQPKLFKLFFFCLYYLLLITFFLNLIGYYIILVTYYNS